MRKIIFILVLFISTVDVWGQGTFKAGWDTYKTSMIIHEYTYNYSSNDSIKLYLADSTQILTAPDSAVVLIVNFPLREKTFNKTINYFNAKKQIIKTEEYKGDNLLILREWKYDEKNRKNYYYEDNKISGKNYKKNYDYSTDKKSGDLIVTESSYYNGKIEFYTKSYYDKKMVKYKEVRLNDNNKDVIHIESYIYGDNGKVIERSVYFPEFKVTKKFTESGADEAPKCSRVMPLNPSEKIFLPGKAIYLKNFLNKIQSILSDPECAHFEYKYTNLVNDIVVCTTKVNYGRQVIFRYKERTP